MTKRKPPNADFSGLRKSIEALPDEQRGAAACLLCELTFLQGTLDKLKTDVAENGVVIKTPHTTKENPALKAYNVSIMRYSQLLKQLTDLIPAPPKANTESNALVDFIKQG